MKKLLTIISALLVIIFAASAAVPALALDNEAYIEKEVTAYMYSMDKTETFTCLFNSDLPDVPFMDVIDFLSKTYILERTLTDNGDGTYTVSCLTGDIDFDVVNDTVYFSCYEISVIYGPYSEGSSLAADYIKGSKIGSIGDVKPMTFDLGKYGFDIVEHNGRVYLPIPVLCDIFCPSYNAAEYIGGCLYFLHTMESSIGDGYFDRSPIYNKPERTPEMAEYTYNELCFQFDYLYGKPSKAAIAKLLGEVGFDRALDEYSDDTRLAKSLLKSTSLVDFYIGLTILFDAFHDGGHTVLLKDPTDAAQLYPETEFGRIWKENFKEGAEGKWATAYKSRRQLVLVSLRRLLINETKKECLSKYERAKVWDGVAELIICGDTAVFSFDSFVNGVVDAFKWSLDYAKDNGIENFVIDLATNGGGSSLVLKYILAMLTNKEKKTATAEIKTLYTITGNVLCSTGKMDLNLDGEYDELDFETYYDFNYAIITSSCSFSCGNLLPVLAQEYGVMILGETSGGGTCTADKLYTPENSYYYVSDFRKFIGENNGDIDSGAPVDVDLRQPYSKSYDKLTEYGIDDAEAAGIYDYEALYDYEAINALIKAFYAEKGDVNADGAVNNKDVIELFRYVSENVEYNAKYDINEDGKVNNRDVTTLFRTVNAA